MFSEKIIYLTCCIIIKMPAFRVDKFSAGRTKYRSEKNMVEQSSTVPNKSIYKDYLNHTLA